MAIMYYNEILARIAKQYKVSLETPYEKLPADFRHKLMHGFDDDLVLPWRKEDKPFAGVLDSVKRMMENAESDERRAKFEAYQSDRTCPDCHGSRLRPESRAATVADKTIVDVMSMPVKDALAFFRQLLDQATGTPPVSSDLAPVKEVLKEIVKRLGFLNDVGLDYLTLDRASATLSGGEMQRIRLASQIGSGLVGVLYVLDEPTIGLHPRDNEKLIAMLHELRDRGNTVVIVEHDGEMMRTADYIVDLGPGAGREGGRVMYQGDYAGLLKAKTLTADYLTGRKTIVQSPSPHPPSSKTRFLTLSGCTEHNLKNITVRIPLGAFTVVTGVSGSGKSTLIDETLKRELMRRFYQAKAVPGKFRKLTGVENIDKVIEIDQSPIGRTPRSNPATYTNLFNDIRDLFASTPDAKARGYNAGRFSFNVRGGRCEACGGDGQLKIEMHFLPDIYVPCEVCKGKRYNRETLEVHYKGRSIADVLEMTVEEALEFFRDLPKLANKLETLRDVGLGYIKLGQSSTTLSGGEAQRVKLATELSKRATGRTIYILDEPTTGLHTDDVRKLLEVLQKLTDAGNTVLVIEHNLDVIKSADYLIDLGPEGGSGGGTLVACGTPEEVAACEASYTGQYLKKVL